jgi:HSP20 family protein
MASLIRWEPARRWQPVRRWEPVRTVRELDSLQQEFGRLFGSLFDTPAGRPANGAAPHRWVPATDLVEHDDHYVLRSDLPGVKDNDVKVELEHNVLTISGRRSSENEQRKDGYRRVERSFGSFSRSLTLPEGIDPEQIHASFERGVLEVSIPKPEQGKPHRVAIAVGDGDSASEGATAGEGGDTDGGAAAPAAAQGA